MDEPTSVLTEQGHELRFKVRMTTVGQHIVLNASSSVAFSSNSVDGNGGRRLLSMEGTRISNSNFYITVSKKPSSNNDDGGNKGGNRKNSLESESIGASNDVEENNWLVSQYYGSGKLSETLTNKNVWIGFTDKETEGEWKWISGEETNYINWMSSQPSNSINPISGEDQDYGWLHPENQGEWDDRWSYYDGQGLPVVTGIAEIKLDPNNLLDIAEHSMCHPGLPYPHGDDHPGSLPEDGFHKTKSRGFFLSSFTLTLYPANKSSVFFPDSFPYSLNFSIEKKTLPELS